MIVFYATIADSVIYFIMYASYSPMKIYKKYNIKIVNL